MSRMQTVLLTSLVMIAFAGNALLCRLALRDTAIDAITFAATRLLSGALTLGLLVKLRDRDFRPAGDWLAALALLTYATTFSFAYVSLPASTGALLLFGAVQATMIGYGLWTGERLKPHQTAGLAVALGGLVVLLMPGLSAPPVGGSLLMLSAGAAWGVYSLRGRGGGDPTSVTAGNFIRASLGAVILGTLNVPWSTVDSAGIYYAVCSGALASGIGYALWYTVLRELKATSAATIQLSVPAIAAFGGVIFLDEIVTSRLLLASAAILGGIAAVVVGKPSLRPVAKEDRP